MGRHRPFIRVWTMIWASHKVLEVPVAMELAHNVCSVNHLICLCIMLIVERTALVSGDNIYSI